MAIVTAKERHGVESPLAYFRWILGLRSVRNALKVAKVTLRAQDLALDEQAEPALAYVNHGQWIADCPTEGCSSASLLLREAGFFCGDCLNASIGYKLRAVRWPRGVSQIEKLLLRRPDSKTRSWSLGEAVAHLREENALNLSKGG
jgi:hypothetical protein